MVPCKCMPQRCSTTRCHPAADVDERKRSPGCLPLPALALAPRSGRGPLLCQAGASPAPSPSTCRAWPPLQSYGGGRDIVGLGDQTMLRGQEFQHEPIFDDGLIEARLGAVSRKKGCDGTAWQIWCRRWCCRCGAAHCLCCHPFLLLQPAALVMPCRLALALQVVGFGSGWHAALTMAQVSSKVHAVRLAQCREVAMELEVHSKVGTVAVQGRPGGVSWSWGTEVIQRMTGFAAGVHCFARRQGQSPPTCPGGNQPSMPPRLPPCPRSRAKWAAPTCRWTASPGGSPSPLRPLRRHERASAAAPRPSLRAASQQQRIQQQQRQQTAAAAAALAAAVEPHRSLAWLCGWRMQASRRCFLTRRTLREGGASGGWRRELRLPATRCTAGPPVWQLWWRWRSRRACRRGSCRRGSRSCSSSGSSSS